MMSAEEQYEQSNKAPATDVTIEADSLLIDAVPEDGYVGHESSNVENEKEMITTVPHEQQSTLSPASDATIEDLEDIHHIKILSKGAQSVGCATKNIDIAECPDTDASKQQAASFPTSKEDCEESDIVQPSNATTQSVDNFDSRNIAETADPTVPREEKEKEPNNTPTAEETRDNDLTMGKITEDIEVGGLESSDVENLEEIDNTGAEQQHKVLSSALEAETQASFPPRNAATEIVEALPTDNDAKKAGLTVQPEECQKESESTLMTNAPRHTGTFVVDAVLDDKVVEQESNNSQNLEEGESTNVHKQQPYLSPVREERHEESEKMSDTNALTEIAQTHYTRDKAQITDPIAISEEVREASHIAPATNPKTATDDLGINSMTVGEAVKLKGSNLENAEEPENEIADEQQRISSKALEEKFGYSSTAKLTIATMEIDATTGTRNNAQTEEMGGPTANFDITEKNTEAEVLPVDRITEDVTVGIIRSTTVEIAEANRMDVNQLSVMCQDVEEHLAASVAVSVHCEIKETADALLIRENTWTIDETVPIQEKHEKTVISPATNETTEA